MKQGYFTSEDLFLFAEGTWLRCYDKLGAHPMKLDGEKQKLAVQQAKDRMELDKKDALNQIAVASAAARALQGNEQKEGE